MLYRAMSNLVENAAKYNRENGSISISASQQQEDIIIKIADTGIGIPKEECERIFEPFYRVDQSRSRSVGGAGLGLALVKDIVEKHRGTSRCAAGRGRGVNSFYIYIQAGRKNRYPFDSLLVLSRQQNYNISMEVTA